MRRFWAKKEGASPSAEDHVSVIFDTQKPLEHTVVCSRGFFDYLYSCSLLTSSAWVALCTNLSISSAVLSACAR